MASTIRRAAANQGVLGGTATCHAVQGHLRPFARAAAGHAGGGHRRLGENGAGPDAGQTVEPDGHHPHGQTRPGQRQPRLPAVLLDRLPEWLRPQAQAAECHWLDTLANALEQHKAQYWADVEALATEACPPVALFDHGRDWLHIGKELRQVYSRVMRQAPFGQRGLPAAVAG
jgi:hypothetical protein